MDFDLLVEYWIKGQPYLYTQGGNVYNANRYYLVDDDCKIFTLEGKKRSYKKKSESFELFLINPAKGSKGSKELCALTKNYFMVLTPFTFEFPERFDIRIEGVSQKSKLPKDIFEKENFIKQIRKSLGSEPIISSEIKNNIVKNIYESPKKLKVSLKPNKKVSVETIQFSIIAELYERIKTSTGKVRKAYLEKLFSIYGGNCESLLRLLVPQLDKRLYHMKESSLAKIYIELLGISEDSQSSQQLLHWKETTESSKKYLEFAEVIYDIISPYLENETKGLTIDEVNKILDDLSQTSGFDEQLKIFRPLIKKLNRLEHKCLIKIIVKRGLPRKLVLDSLHKDANDLYNISFSLAKVCSVIQQEVIYNIIEIFIPIAPMLASRKNPNNIELNNLESPKKCLLYETKFDGERIQVHKQGNKVMLFSRKGNNTTTIYSSVIPNILKYVKGNEVILDGEILVWNKKENKYDAFGGLKSYAKENAIRAINKKNEEETKNLAIMFFDILYYDKPILNVPLTERRKLLEKVVPKSAKGKIEIAHQEEICDLVALDKAIDTAIENREEGIILKNPTSLYEPGERSKMWVKLKPQYFSGTGDTFDCIIVGCYYGTKFGKEFTKFLCAVSDPTHTVKVGKKQEPLLLTFVRIGSGFNTEQLQLINELVEGKTYKYDENKIAKNVIIGKDRPDVLIKPEDSIVIEITGVQLTKIKLAKYSSGYSLRFPVFVKIRYDKDFSQITTLQELIDIDKEFGGLNIGKFRKDDPNKSPVKIDEPVKYDVIPKNKPADIGVVLKKSDIFKGLEICVMNGSEKYDKHTLEKLIYANGGDFTQNPMKNTKYIIAERPTVRVKNYKGLYPVLKPKWITQCDKKGKLLKIDKYKLF